MSPRQVALIAALALAFGQSAHANETLRVGKSTVQSYAYLPLDIGIKQGFFARHGLTVEEINFTGGGKLAQAMAANAADIAMSAGAEMAFTAKGAPEIAVATVSTSPAYLGIAVGATSTLRDIDDLAGKKIGVTSPGSLTFWMVEHLNRVKGWTGDQRAIPMVVGGSPTSSAAALKSRAVDATLGAVETGYLLEERHDGRLLLHCSDYVEAMLIVVVFANTALVRDRPEALREFLVAWFETVDYMRGHRAETVRETVSEIGYSPAIAERSYDELMPTFSNDGKFEPRSLQTTYESFVELEIVAKSVDITTLYTERFLPERRQRSE